MEYYIYGYGKKGKMILQLLKKDVVVGVIDNFKKSKDEKIFTFNEIKSAIGEAKVIICVPNDNYDEIEKQLRLADVKNYEIYEDFIKKINSVKMLQELGALSLDLELNQNIESEVEFYIVDSFELEHFLPIYEYFNSHGVNVQIVVEPASINAVGDYIDYEHCTIRLKEKQIPYTTFRNSNANLAITTQFARCLKHYKNRKCQLSYGVALYKPTAFQMIYENESEFDCFLVHGIFQKQHLNNILGRDDAFIIGYPKYWNCSMKVDRTLKKRNNILYCPTWDEYSSIKDYSSKINELRNQYHIITRPHHCTWRLEEKKDEKNILIAVSDEIMEPETNLLYMLNDIDVVICDAKSAVVFEIAFLKPDVRIVVIADKVDKNDFYLNLQNIAMVIDDPEKLEENIKWLLQEDVYKSKRKEIIDTLYDGTYGQIDEFVEYIKEMRDV